MSTLVESCHFCGEDHDLTNMGERVDGQEVWACRLCADEVRQEVDTFPLTAEDAMCFDELSPSEQATLTYCGGRYTDDELAALDPIHYMPLD